jgi:hypothetical protein
VVGALLAKGFLEKVDADMRKGEPVWRETGDGHGVTLVATDAGLAAIGIEPEDANPAPAGATDAPTEEPAPDTPAPNRSPAPKTRTPREGTKQATLIAMLRARRGGDPRRDRGGHWMVAAHRERGNVGGAEKEARPDHHLREGRGTRPALSPCPRTESPAPYEPARRLAARPS